MGYTIDQLTAFWHDGKDERLSPSKVDAIIMDDLGKTGKLDEALAEVRRLQTLLEVKCERAMRTLCRAVGCHDQPDADGQWTHLLDAVSRQRTELAVADEHLATCRVEMDRARHDATVLTVDNARLRTELDDRDEAHRRVMAEQCAPDERHCTCVPALRAEVRRLQKEDTEQKAQLANLRQSFESYGNTLRRVEEICGADWASAKQEVLDHGNYGWAMIVGVVIARLRQLALGDDA